MILAIISMVIYLTYRFQLKMALSAVITLIHDITIILGILSFFKINFDLTVLSAIFAVFGYSINDTVVIFDRIRENKIRLICFLTYSLYKLLSTNFSSLNSIILNS